MLKLTEFSKTVVLLAAVFRVVGWARARRVHGHIGMWVVSAPNVRLVEVQRLAGVLLVGREVLESPALLGVEILRLRDHRVLPFLGGLAGWHHSHDHRTATAGLCYS